MRIFHWGKLVIEDFGLYRWEKLVLMRKSLKSRISKSMDVSTLKILKTENFCRSKFSRILCCQMWIFQILEKNKWRIFENLFTKHDLSDYSLIFLSFDTNIKIQSYFYNLRHITWPPSFGAQHVQNNQPFIHLEC